MTAEQWLWVVSILLALLGFWLRDWKERVDAALASKQAQIDKLTQANHELEVTVATCVKQDEINALRAELKTDIRAGFEQIRQLMEASK